MGLLKRMKLFFRGKTIKKILGAGPLLLLTGFLIEGLAVICRHWVSIPVALSREARILLTIPFAVAGLLGLIRINRYIIRIGVNLSDGHPEMMTAGPFACVRHPLYAVLIWAAPPIPIIWFADLLFFIPWILIIVVSHFIVSIEERRLVVVFGENYEDYRKRVPALIPDMRRSRRN